MTKKKMGDDMSKRKSLSKKARFEVFKRDSFTCQYCGRNPPSIVLEIDHIDPVANGGGNNIENLITACFDCNRGKSKHLLSSVHPPLSDHYEKITEAEEQIKEHKKLLANIKRRKTREENKIDTVFSSYFTDREITKHYKKTTIRTFLDKLPLVEVEEAMELACLKIDRPSDALKYFCGICWNKIKDGC